MLVHRYGPQNNSDSAIAKTIENLFGTEQLSIGVAYDTAADSFERVGAGQGEPTGELIDMSVHPIFSQLTRSVIADNGDVFKDISWLNFSKHVDGTNVDHSGANGQEMVRYMDLDMNVGPRYYHAEEIGGKYVILLSHFPLDGKDGRQFTMHPLFSGLRKVYNGAYELVNYNSKGWSVPYSPADGTTIVYPVTTRSGDWGHADLDTEATDTLCEARGNGWQQYDFWIANWERLLLLTGYASYDIPGIVGAGRINQSGGTWTNGSYIGAQHYDLAGGYASAVQNGGTTYDTDFAQVLGVYNTWGNVWKRVASLIDDHDVYAKNQEPYTYSGTTGWTRVDDATDTGITLPASDGYAGVPHSGLGLVLPSDVTGSSSTKMHDYYIQNTGFRVFRVGGSAIYGSSAGPFSWNAAVSVSAANTIIGGRLCFKAA
ncbi:hypothetical protein [Prosthecochloris sp.]|uniref:hypothetical protein n=1 Tax=Prosthecochloris sp. TaxID=290513 RepID=UPI0025F75274|nr:hypothetical protein [Prosthecochloris sp.]